MRSPTNSPDPRPASPETRLLASMGHSLRTPLNQVLGFSELLTEEVSGPLNEKQRTQASSIGKAGDQLLEIVDDLVLLAEVRGGSVHVSQESSSLSGVLSRVAEIGNPISAPAVVIEVPEALEACALDSFWLERASTALIRAGQLLSIPDRTVAVTAFSEESVAAHSGIEVVFEPLAEVGSADAGESLDIADFAAVSERRVYGSGVKIGLAAAIAFAAGGGAVVQALDSGPAVRLRLWVPSAAGDVERFTPKPQLQQRALEGLR